MSASFSDGGVSWEAESGKMAIWKCCTYTCQVVEAMALSSNLVKQEEEEESHLEKRQLVLVDDFML